jgi:hypothetical protein
MTTLKMDILTSNLWRNDKGHAALAGWSHAGLKEEGKY